MPPLCAARELLADRKEEVADGLLHPTEIGRRAGRSGEHRSEGDHPLAPCQGPPIRAQLDRGGDRQQHSERPAEPGEEGGADREPVTALPESEEGDEGRQEQQRLGVAHHEDEGRWCEGEQPHRPAGASLVAELEDDEVIEHGEGRQRGEVGDNDQRRPGCGSRQRARTALASTGSNGKNRKA